MTSWNHSTYSILMLKLSLLWPAGVPSSWLLCHYDMTLVILDNLFSSTHYCLGFSYIFCSQTWTLWRSAGSFQKETILRDHILGTGVHLGYFSGRTQKKYFLEKKNSNISNSNWILEQFFKKLNFILLHFPLMLNTLVLNYFSCFIVI